MLKDNLLEALNTHVNAEIYSAYLYLSMSAYLDAEHLSGMAHWMKVQAQEELGHAMKFYGFILERGGAVQLGPVAGPPVRWESPLVLFEEVYRHECHVTSLIHKLMDLAVAEKDYATTIFLQGFVTEQVEEEAHAESILHRIRMVEGSKNGLLMMDHQLAKRA